MIKEVASYFFKLGFTGFGGPLALVATMQKDLIERRGWLEPERFQNAFSLIKAMPGPVAFSSAVYLGRTRAGFFGGLLAGLFLILPAFFLMLAFGWLLAVSPDAPWIQSALLGMQVTALGVIATSVLPLARGFERERFFWIIALAGGLLAWKYSSYEPVIILASGALSVLIARRPKAGALMILGILNLPLPAQADFDFEKLGSLIWVCFKAGAFVFGTGLAIVPMLEADVVGHYGWLSQTEFLNAVALGQITPGPVVITATYIGLKVAGVVGAVVSTISVFLPSFVHMTTWFPSGVEWLSEQSWVRDFTRGALGAVVGMIVGALIKLGAAVSWQIPLGALFVFTILVLHKKWLPVWLVIPLGGVVVWLVG